MDDRSAGVAGLTFSQNTHTGLLRRSNEDCCGASLASCAFVVCDGMGGAAAGEVASHLAVQTFLQHLDAASGAGSAKTRLAEAVRAANLAVFRRARATSDLEGMGTTLVAALLEAQAEKHHPQRLWIAHVGDSRCYLLRNATLRLLTSDHTIVEEQIRAGLITRQEAELSPVRHVITRAIGSRSMVQPEIQQVEVSTGDLVLLASDGLSRELPDPAIEHLLKQVPEHAEQEAVATACRNLIDAANALGGRDNVSVMLLRIG